MADVRALLRQQRTARRIDHPHAVYSDSGKLSCAVCREAVRPESAWDDHLKSAQHRQNVRAVQALQSHTVRDGSTEGQKDTSANGNGNGHSTHTKRRHSETEDDGDVEMGSDGDEDAHSRKKQHRADLPAGVKPTVEKPTIEIKSPIETKEQEPSPTAGGKTEKGHEPRKMSLSTTPQLTPPLGRRTSGTPSQGVEMRIPSRPATPIAIKDSFLGGSFGGSGAGSGSGSGSNSGGLPSAASTPKIAPLGRSPLIPQEAHASTILPGAAAALSASRPLNEAVNGTKTAASTRPTTATTATIVEEEAAPGIAQAEIDEDEWAAFEAEVVNAPAAVPQPTGPGNGRPDMNGGLVASAPAVSAQELTTVEGDDDERSKKREAEEAKLEDEKEEATRALEDEFEDMQELESRVQKLKEKREALRSQSNQPQPGQARPREPSTTSVASLAPPVVLDSDTTARRPSATMIDKENIRQQLEATHGAAKGQPVEESSDEDDDEDEEDWDAFRFR